MGNACCSDSSDNRMYDPSMKRVNEYEPTSSLTNSIKFPFAKVPKKHPLVDQLNSESGIFSAKNPLTIPSGTPAQARQLNSAGLIYYGQWSNGIPHGKGELYYPDGSYYVGYFNKGNADGEGRFVSPEGWIYEGQLENQQAQGKGILYHKDLKYKYQGMWSGDLPNGYGRQQWQNKNIFYEGEYLNGKKHGQGVYRTPDFEYRGNFNDNQFDSYGYIAYKSGDKFQGLFEKGKRHGNGTYTWADGSYYQGNYKHDLKQGQGKYKSQESVYWEGEWMMGKREGAGKLITPQKKYTGNWRNGIAEQPNPSQLRSNLQGGGYSGADKPPMKSHMMSNETSIMR